MFSQGFLFNMDGCNVAALAFCGALMETLMQVSGLNHFGVSSFPATVRGAMTVEFTMSFRSLGVLLRMAVVPITYKTAETSFTPDHGHGPTWPGSSAHALVSQSHVSHGEAVASVTP
jgi:hypothetical protein